MPQANDGELTRLITVQTGGTVQDPAPNQPQPGAVTAEPSFDLLLEAVAGNALGHTGDTYTLTITAFDLTAGNQPALNPAGSGVNTPNGQAFNTANHWTPFGAPIEYVNNQRFTINVPAGAFTGHVIIYTASLVSTDFDEAWLIVGDPFVLC